MQKFFLTALNFFKRIELFVNRIKLFKNDWNFPRIELGKKILRFAKWLNFFQQDWILHKGLYFLSLNFLKMMELFLTGLNFLNNNNAKNDFQVVLITIFKAICHEILTRLNFLLTALNFAKIIELFAKRINRFSLTL